MDLRRIRKGEAIAALAGLGLIVALFLPWYELQAVFGALDRLQPAIETTGTAWEAFSLVDLLLALLALAGIGCAAITAARRTPGGPVTAIVLTTGLGILVTLLVLYRLINEPGPNDLVQLQLGAYLGLLLAFGVTAGAWIAMADERLETFEPPALPAEPAPPATAAAGSAVATGSVPDAPGSASGPALDSPADAEP